MSTFAALLLDVFAQSEGGKGSGKGDSSLIFIVAMAILGLVVVTAILLVIRARSPEQATSGRTVTPPQDSAERDPSGRPLHTDPDPDDLAGGRARMTDPLEDTAAPPRP